MKSGDAWRRTRTRASSSPRLQQARRQKLPPNRRSRSLRQERRSCLRHDHGTVEYDVVLERSTRTCWTRTFLRLWGDPSPRLRCVSCQVDHSCLDETSSEVEDGAALLQEGDQEDLESTLCRALRLPQRALLEWRRGKWFHEPHRWSQHPARHHLVIPSQSTRRTTRADPAVEEGQELLRLLTTSTTPHHHFHRCLKYILDYTHDNLPKLDSNWRTSRQSSTEEE